MGCHPVCKLRTGWHPLTLHPVVTLRTGRRAVRFSNFQNC